MLASVVFEFLSVSESWFFCTSRHHVARMVFLSYRPMRWNIYWEMLQCMVKQSTKTGTGWRSMTSGSSQDTMMSCKDTKQTKTLAPTKTAKETHAVSITTVTRTAVLSKMKAGASKAIWRKVVWRAWITMATSEIVTVVHIQWQIVTVFRKAGLQATSPVAWPEAAAGSLNHPGAAYLLEHMTRKY